MTKTHAAIAELSPRFSNEAVALVDDWFKTNMKAETAAYRALTGEAQKEARDPSKSTGDVALGYSMLLRHLEVMGLLDIENLVVPTVETPDDVEVQPVSIPPSPPAIPDDDFVDEPTQIHTDDDECETRQVHTDAEVLTVEDDAIDSPVVPATKLCGICGSPMRQVTEKRKQRGAVTYFQCPARRTHPKKTVQVDP